MSYEEYWEGAWYLPKYYYEAYIIREKNKNRDMWQQGRYFYNGISIALSNAFSKKGAKTHDYPEKPYRIFNPTQEELEQEQREEEAKMQEVLEAMMREQKEKSAQHSNERNG